MSTVKNGPWLGNLLLAPMSQGSNAPYRRLCVEYGATTTLSEMVFASTLCQGRRREQALIRRTKEEPCFGVQILASDPVSAVEASLQAANAGADFIDLNAGCPIALAIKKGMGSKLIERPRNLERILTLLVEKSPLPVTVKLRTGFKDDHINIAQTSAIAIEAGVQGIVLHGRTQQQRYTGCANWDIISELAEQSSVPVVGNGDILTWYEAADKQRNSKVAGIMIGRGALIKPWIFQEIKEQRELNPTPSERLEVYRRLGSYFLEHFGNDDYGQRAARNFMTWHCDFFYRYRYLPEADWREASRQHPLLQTRFDSLRSDDPLELVLASGRKKVHEQLAAIIIASLDPGICPQGGLQWAAKQAQGIDLTPNNDEEKPSQGQDY